jgi:hypothetical protein
MPKKKKKGGNIFIITIYFRAAKASEIFVTRIKVNIPMTPCEIRYDAEMLD